MQSSMSKLQRVVSLKLRSNNNRPASNYFLQLQHDYFAASQSRDYDGNTSNKPYSNVNVNRNIDITRERRRMHSTSTSTTLVASNNKSFWRDLHQAVQQGNGSHAEEIVDQVLKDYYRSNNLSSSASSTPTTIVDKNNDHQHFHSNVNISSSSSSSSSSNNNKNNNNNNNKHNISPVG